MAKVLIIDDDPVQCRLSTEILKSNGFEALEALSGPLGLDILEDQQIDAVILDLVMPEMDGMAVMAEMSKRQMNHPVIVQTANSSIETIVTAMRHGAVDFFVKPVAPERLIISLENALKRQSLETCLRTERNRLSGHFGFDDIITKSPIMDRVKELGNKASASNIPVLIEGESGTGKELIARAIQASSKRANKPFVTVNCGAIPPNLVESTLFGHKKGSFTGANTDQKGKFQEADGGTLFLDEIGELPLDMQVKLLRALQEGEVEPIGAAKPEKVDVRIISATNKRLLNLTKEGHFREDLFYRLNVFPIYLPPLRERMDDLDALIAHFIARFSAEEGRHISQCTPKTVAMLKSYDWPGNVRQLENTIYRAVVLASNAVLETEDFPQICASLEGADRIRHQLAARPNMAIPVHIDQISEPTPIVSPEPTKQKDRFVGEDGDIAPLDNVERDLIAFALDQYQGKMSAVARALGIGRSTLYRKIKEYGLEESDAA
ncbi:sigma-54-dependent transcriptional regulator [Maritalea porphyrae]|uniref:DNA-binding transcriptional regulator NtrC n=1 Tax=Maritalea porphyrae TaxID=880732 RepID=A0ABQ5UM10_9HYPH|nr:sigma-54 dependent transcriptional regulator [Maritalea porphyrae]GLQ16303.1 sigma-54-dependent Fis family transcriptional regulator [Maritalea porphyrae]